MRLPARPLGHDHEVLRDVEGDDMPYVLEAVDARQFVIAIGNVVVNRISFDGSDPATPRAMRIQPVGIEGPPQILERVAQPGYPAAELQAAYDTLFEQTGLGLDGALAAPGSDQPAFDPAPTMREGPGEGPPRETELRHRRN